MLRVVVDPGARVDHRQQEGHPLERLPVAPEGDREDAAVQHQEVGGEEGVVPLSRARESRRQIPAHEPPAGEGQGVVAQGLRHHGSGHHDVEREGDGRRNHTVLLLPKPDGDEEQPVAPRDQPRRKAMPAAARVELPHREQRGARDQPERHPPGGPDPAVVHRVLEDDPRTHDETQRAELVERVALVQESADPAPRSGRDAKPGPEPRPPGRRIFGTGWSCGRRDHRGRRGGRLGLLPRPLLDRAQLRAEPTERVLQHRELRAKLRQLLPLLVPHGPTPCRAPAPGAYRHAVTPE